MLKLEFEEMRGDHQENLEKLNKLQPYIEQYHEFIASSLIEDMSKLA